MTTESFIAIIFVFAIVVIGMLCILLIALAAPKDNNLERTSSHWWHQPQLNSKTGWLPVIGLLVATLGAVAGLLQVREVRIYLGLDPPAQHNGNKRIQNQQPDVYSIRVFNCDDECRALINGTLIVRTDFGEDTGWIDVTSNLKPKTNTIRFQVVNNIGAITYGFQVRKNNSTVYEQLCGTVRVSGCEGNRQDFPKGVARVFTFNLTLP